MSLTDTAIKSAKAGIKPYKLSDARGLYLLVTCNGSKLWRVKYRFADSEKLLPLGKYPDVSLMQAREGTSDARKQLAVGIDPMAVRKAKKLETRVAAKNNFQSVAIAWWEQWKAAKSERHANDVLRRLHADVFPAIGAKPISSIKVTELVAMVTTISQRGALDIAKRALQVSGQVFRYAVAFGITDRNPVSDIKPSDVISPRKTTNYARIEARELPELLRHIEAYQGSVTTRLAMKLMSLTFVRTSELIGARWEEFNFEEGRWDVPSSRMKMKTPHIVPLSTQAISVLKTLQIVTGNSPLLFPSERDHEKCMSNNTILGALKRMGYQGRMTGHGFRGVASTLLHEMGFKHAHIELQLAHQERNSVSAAYNYAIYLNERKSMMQHWGDYLEGCISQKVLPMKRRAA